MDAATLVYDIDSSQAVGAAKALLQMERAAADAARATEHLQKSVRDAYRNSKGQYQTQAKALSDQRDAIRDLAAEFNPVLSAQLKFAEAEKRAAQAVREGVTSKEQAEITLAGLSKQYMAAAAAQQQFGASAEVASHHVMNLGYQLNDIGMMMALGQNPFALMMQQGPQVAQIFAQMNAEGRKIGPTLLSAFTSILNPTTLVTLALIGGAAAFVQWATGGRDAAEANTAFEDSLSNLAAAANSYSAALATANQNSFALTAQFGAQADGLQRLYDLNVQLEQIKLGAAIRESAEQARAAYEGLDSQLQNIIRLSRAAQDEVLGMGTATDMLDAAIRKMTESFGLGVGQAVDLNRALEDMANARTMEEQALAAEAFGEALVDASRSGAQIPPELIRIASEAGVAAVAIREIAAASRDAAAAWTSVGQNTGDFISGYEMPPMPAAPAGRGGRGGGGGGGGGRSSGGGGGGGGGISEAERLREDMKERYKTLAEGFQAEYALAMQTYVRDQETLQFALDNKLISLQEYERQKAMLYTQTWGTEYEQNALQYALDQQALEAALEQKLITHQDYNNRLREMQWAQVQQMGQISNAGWAQELNQMANAFGQMNQLAGGNYDKLLKAQRVFAAASALISTMQGAAKALELPFPLNIAAAGKVIAAGMGFIGAIKSGSYSGSGGGGAAANPAPSTTQAPVQNVLVNLSGDQWMVDMAGEVIDQIAEQSRNGRVIIQRDHG